MKVLGKSSISSLVNLLLKVIFVLGVIVIICLPKLLDWYVSYFPADHVIYYPMLIVLYLSGIMALFAVFGLIKLFETLKKNTPFITENVKHLKAISICCLIIAIIYLVGIFVFQSAFVVVIFIMFTIASLAFLILAELFKQAVEYKEENDLTI